MKLTRKGLHEWARRERAGFEALLKEFVEVPSVSADPVHRGDILRMAELAAATIRRFGGHAELHHVKGGTPAVLGSFDGGGKGAPTVTVYNHMDVQPASRETEPWDSEPFVFTRRGDTYLGRGSTDDKGPALTALFGARAALEAGVPVNLRFLWETEEEIGSPHFASTLRKMGRAARTDAVVVSDTVWVSRGRPSISTALRGLQRFTFTLETAHTDQHSGVTGGAARNPVAELCALAADLHDPRTGRIRIPGFYDDVPPLSAREKKDFLASGFSVKRFMRDHGFHAIRSRDPLDVMRRLWALPTLEVHGLVGGYTGPGVKTIVPPRAELKVSIRLVPEMKASRVVEQVTAYVRERHPDVVVTPGSSAPPYRGRTEGPFIEAAQEALRFAFGRAPVFVREGGTIGAVLAMEQILGVPIAFLGLSLPEHGYHAPNENYDWGQASGGIVAFARYFEIVAQGVR